MASDRINYGIDLGTTNTVIARVEKGTPVVVKSKSARGMQLDATPSAVAYEARRGRFSTRVGSQALIQWHRDAVINLEEESDLENAFVEFKRTMGTDHAYKPSDVPDQSYNSEQLSARVLKEVRRYAEDIRAAIVTVPAAFMVPQSQATLRAAALAGLAQCELLMEPVAAAMAYGLDNDAKTGSWLVFDFGGGTFDAALVVSEDGDIAVKDTEGDNHLGGRDIDLAVVEEIIFSEVSHHVDLNGFISRDPQNRLRLRKVFKKFAEEISITLSSQDSCEVVTEPYAPIKLWDGQEIELDFTVTRKQLRPVVEPIFQRAIDMAKVLLQRNGISGVELDELILVGGPTYSPILRQMLSEQIRKPNTSMDPMTVVAKGAAIYASTVSLDLDVIPGPDLGQQVLLEVGYDSTTISPTAWVSVKCGDLPDSLESETLEIEIVATNSKLGWRTGKQRLTGQGALFELRLEDDRPNVFDLIATTQLGDRLSTHPSEITIIHGIKVSGAPLPNNLGVEVLNSNNERVFAPLRGAEKSKLLPVTGTSSHLSLSTDVQIRPGVSTDQLLIRIYEGGANAPNVPVGLCDHVMTLQLTGDQVTQVIPAGTPVEVVMVTQTSSHIPETVRVVFPKLDSVEFKLEIPSAGHASQWGWISDEVVAANKRIKSIRDLNTVDESRLTEIETNINNLAERSTEANLDIDAVSQAGNRLKRELQGLHKLFKDNEWQLAEIELDKAWNELLVANREEGHDDLRNEIQEAKRNLDRVKNARDPHLARELTKSFNRMIYLLKRCEWYKRIIQWARHEYYDINWKHAGQARSAIRAGVSALVADKPCSELKPLARAIMSLVVLDSTDDPRPPVPRIEDFS